MFFAHIYCSRFFASWTSFAKNAWYRNFHCWFFTFLGHVFVYFWVLSGYFLSSENFSWHSQTIEGREIHILQYLYSLKDKVIISSPLQHQSILLDRQRLKPIGTIPVSTEDIHFTWSWSCKVFHRDPVFRVGHKLEGGDLECYYNSLIVVSWTGNTEVLSALQWVHSMPGQCCIL